MSMWKKRFNREKEKHVGNPVLTETTYDEKLLNRIPHISEVQSPGSAPDHSVGYDPPDLGSLQPPPGVSHRVSSIYSQPSPEFQNQWHQSMVSSHYSQADVSPPISPVEESSSNIARSSSMRDVSPVEETANTPFGPRARLKQPSHIPIAYKGSAGPGGPQPSTERFWNANPGPSKTTRWDVYSGEPTTSEKTGKLGQVKPGVFAPATHPIPESALSPTEYTVSVTTTKRPAKQPNKRLTSTLAERAARLGGKGLRVETKPRPEWKGASGRAPLVQPVRDAPEKRTFSVPRKIQRTLSPVMSDSSGRNTPSSATIQRKLSPDPDTNNVSFDSEQTSRQGDNEIKPIVPLKAGLNSPRGSLPSPISAVRPTAHPYPSPITPSKRHEAPTSNVTNPPSAHSSKRASKNIDRATPPRKSVESSRTGKEEHNLGSRFSWTTHGTNSTYQHSQHSPPPSPPPPMPSVIAVSEPIAIEEEPPTAVPSLSASSHRKPVPRPSSPALTVQTMATMATMGSAKALPRPPPELESVDLISNLQAQLDDLEIRRSNVRRLIRDLTKVQTTNPLVSDFATRRENTRKVKEFEEELAEIGSLEHDIGLRLHRAWKRREKDEVEGPTSLWIRRVTG